MSRNGDVMRSDRLKQVMQQIDPNFDERNAGFNRFSKFVTEAGTKGLLRVAKLDNGQYEVAPVERSHAPERAHAPERSHPPARTPGVEAERENGKGRRGGRGRGRGRGREGAAKEREPATTAPAAAPAAGGQLALAAAFQLLARALGELPAPVGGEALRARMAAIHGKEDALLDPARFGRLLRQANDAEIADVRKVGEDSYEVTPHRAHGSVASHAVQPQAAAEPAEENGNQPAATGAPAAGRSAALRFRRGSRSMVRPPELPLVGVVHVDEPPAEKAPAKEPKGRSRGGRKAAQSDATAEEAPAAPTASAPRKRGRSRKPSA